MATGAAVKLCSGFGQFHSPANKAHPLDYVTITMADIERMAANPPSIEKSKARWVIFSILLSRVHTEQREKGRFHALWADIDEVNGMTFNDIVERANGCLLDFLAYTSRSSTEEKQKSRIIVPLADAVDGNHFVRLQKILNDKLEENGVTPDRATERAGQVCYLPNRGKFYLFHIEKSSGPMPADAWVNEEQVEINREKAAEKSRKERREQARLKATRRMQTGCKSPIDAYNAEFGLEMMLDAYGYIRRGNRWLSPNSGSKAPGMSITNDGRKWLSCHNSDASIGTPTSNGTMGDAFDLYIWYEHRGDRDAAIRAAAEMFGLNHSRTVDGDIPLTRSAKVSPIEHIIGNIQLKGGCRGESVRGGVVTDNKSQQMTTFDNISLEGDGRDEALTHLANHLVKGGMPVANIRKYMHFFGSHCTPPLPEIEIQAKIKSALDRSEARDRNLTQDIRDLIVTTSGNITTTFVYQCQHLTTRDEKKKATAILSRLVKEGLIERTGNRAGEYRKVESECEQMDFLNAETETADIWLPFNLHRMVETMPGNLILIAGEPNAGKTGLLLNIIRQNQHKFETHYFNSEMGGSELRKRLSLFTDILPSQWRFKAWERADNFADVIKPGKGRLNIIDFLELHDNFYEIGGRLAEIHKKLKGAVAIIALQKNAGVDTGLGGFRGLEKPRLYLAMSPGRLKIVKAKNWKTDQNPNGLQYEFKVAQGCRFITVRDWHRQGGNL
ncbi:DnaB-like helicase C-terminal domain-containing protein [Desulfosarcina ovata]|nr:DnaB-like helicase C-terminal domain-containing protein [Desulfosarcina ovata]